MIWYLLRLALALEGSLENFSEAQLNRQTKTNSPGEMDQNFFLVLVWKCLNFSKKHFEYQMNKNYIENWWYCKLDTKTSEIYV